AGVGKPTIYKCCSTKPKLVFAMLCDRMSVHPETPPDMTAADARRGREWCLMDAFSGPFGKLVAWLIAAARREPASLQECDQRLGRPRRTALIAELERAKAAGELRADTGPLLLADAVFGTIYYRLLLRLGPLTRRVGEELVEQVLRGHRSRPAPATSSPDP